MRLYQGEFRVNRPINDHSYNVQARLRVPGEIKRREVELDPQPRRGHEQGGGAGLRKLDFFRFGLFLNSSATDIVLVTLPSTAVETATARCTSRCAMASGNFWRRSTVSPIFFGRYSRSSLHSFVLSPLFPLPVTYKQPRFCGRKATRSLQDPSAQTTKCMIVSFSDNPLFNPLLAQVPVSGGGGSHAGAASRKLLISAQTLSGT